MSRTVRPASARALRVPPVEISSTPKVGQAAGQVDQAGLVADAEQGAADGTRVMMGFLLYIPTDYNPWA